MGVLPKRCGTWQRLALAVLAILTIAWPHMSLSADRAAAAGPQCPVAGARVVSFARELDGSGFVTAEGEEVRLSGILARDAGGETGAVNEATAARSALGAALRDRTIAIAPAATEKDRYGRTLAQVFADDTWVQAALIEAGEARVAPDLASATCVKVLLAAETRAREARKGQWRSAFRVREPDGIRSRVGSFEIVEGSVTTASVNRGRAFINFGADYRTDFTVTIAPEDMRAFRQARFDVPALAGKRVRVRGWVEFYNGPEITLTTPASIEVLE
jgi:micrococcal nuclease